MQNSKNLDLRWISRRFFYLINTFILQIMGNLKTIDYLKQNSLDYITLANSTAITFCNFTLNTKLYHSFYTET